MIAQEAMKNEQTETDIPLRLLQQRDQRQCDDLQRYLFAQAVLRATRARREKKIKGDILCLTTSTSI